MSAPAWLQLLLLVFIGGVLLEAPWLIYFSAAVAMVIGVSHYWRLRALDRVRYTRRFHFTRGFPGEKTELRVSVENNKLLPVSWLETADHWPHGVGPEDIRVLAPSHIEEQGLLVNLYSLRWFQRVNRTYTLLFRKRGIYQVGPLTLQAGDLFGMYEQRREDAKTELLTVFPEMLPLEQLRLPAEDPFGDRRAFKPLFEDPSRPIGIRPYHPEDGFRRIHWAATARTGEMQSKLYQPVTARMLVACLNVSTEMQYWMGYSSDLLEHLVKVTATLVHQCFADGYAVGLFSNGSLAHADQPFRIQPGRSPNQPALLLQALAGVTPFVTAPFETFLIRSMSQIPFGATLVIITALLPETLQDTLIRLRRYRAHITLISLSKDPPPEMPGINVLHLPFHKAEEALPTPGARS